MRTQHAPQAAGEGANSGQGSPPPSLRPQLPPTSRVDDYLEGGNLAEASLEALRNHQLCFAAAPEQRDEMARQENLDDYVVEDPL